jgi:hypothetical protein
LSNPLVLYYGLLLEAGCYLKASPVEFDANNSIPEKQMQGLQV